MRSDTGGQAPDGEVRRLIEELNEAEAYERRLKQFIVDAKEQLASGHPATALSVLNEALSYIDAAPDVVTGRGG